MKTNERISALLSLVGFRAAAAGLLFVMGPRWTRRIFADFSRLTDSEMRLLGYVLIGTSVSVFAQKATQRLLGEKIDALVEKARPESAGAELHATH